MNLFPENLAWLWDIIAMLISTVILLVVVKISGRIQKSGILPTYITRKIIHIIVAPIFLVCWLLFSGAISSRYIALIVPVLFVVQFAAIGTGILKDEDFVRSMSRTGDPKELLRGTLFYSVVIALVTLFWFYIPRTENYQVNPGAFIIIGCLAGGDGLADIFGRKFGGSKTFGIAGAKKTIAGSLAMFFGSFVFSLILLGIFSISSDTMNLASLLLPLFFISLIATIIEVLSPPSLDNLLISIGIMVIIVILGLLSPAWWPYSISTFIG
ncbi:MAG: hypothetical protein DRO88_04705 [Promethearchaeia archaeon]|nr:MAG: hypothetical protein DRO88_04705 [Candidatus Lokiarchaeia archaeon]